MKYDRVKTFAWLPTLVNGKWIWFEYYYDIYVFTLDKSTDELGWVLVGKELINY